MQGFHFSVDGADNRRNPRRQPSRGTLNGIQIVRTESHELGGVAVAKVNGRQRSGLLPYFPVTPLVWCQRPIRIDDKNILFWMLE